MLAYLKEWKVLKISLFEYTSAQFWQNLCGSGGGQVYCEGFLGKSGKEPEWRSTGLGSHLTSVELSE